MALQIALVAASIAAGLDRSAAPADVSPRGGTDGSAPPRKRAPWAPRGGVGAADREAIETAEARRARRRARNIRIAERQKGGDS